MTFSQRYEEVITGIMAEVSAKSGALLTCGCESCKNDNLRAAVEMIASLREELAALSVQND